MKREQRNTKAIRNSGFVELLTAILDLKRRLVECSGNGFHAETDLNAETVRLTKQAIKTLRAPNYKEDGIAAEILVKAKSLTDLESFSPIRKIEKYDGWEIDLDLTFVNWLIDKLRDIAKLNMIVLPREEVDWNLRNKELDILRNDKRELESDIENCRSMDQRQRLIKWKNEIGGKIKDLDHLIRARKQRERSRTTNCKRKKTPKKRG